MNKKSKKLNNILPENILYFNEFFDTILYLDTINKKQFIVFGEVKNNMVNEIGKYDISDFRINNKKLKIKSNK